MSFAVAHFFTLNRFVYFKLFRTIVELKKINNVYSIKANAENDAALQIRAEKINAVGCVKMNFDTLMAELRYYYSGSEKQSRKNIQTLNVYYMFPLDCVSIRR